MTRFSIAELALAGGILALGPVPVGVGLTRLQAWKPRLVVSLTPLQELRELGAEMMPQALGQARWRHFPIKDYGIPRPDQAADWQALCAEIMAELSSRARVFIHCRGGCGRSGMIVLRLMTGSGEAPDDALARLRSVRPCAVETTAQLEWGRG